MEKKETLFSLEEEPVHCWTGYNWIMC